MQSSEMNPAAVPPPIPGARQRNWMDRNWKWFVPAVVLSFVLALAGFIFLFVWGVFGAMKSNEPYRYAMSRAVSDSRVQSALGSPIKDRFLMSGNINTSGSSGRALFDIGIYGPKNSGNLHVEATKAAGVWTYSSLEVTGPGQAEKIILTP